ncbi:MAG: choice-of-anchor Q domain-containing protein [Candidatus Competibacteraceae bacterium]|nr:choice-of-anchor Q domain-containing protein [Candidatus Competibacteraceae bacterium]
MNTKTYHPLSASQPRRRLLAILISQALGAGAFTSAQADTITVPCNVDALINAIDFANGNGQADVINLNSNCTYTLTAIHNTTDGNNGLPSITSTITINGNGATIERSITGYTTGLPNDFRLLHIAENGNLTLNQLTLTGGLALAPVSLDYVFGTGGGLFNRGKVSLTNSTLSGNSAANFGGGFFNYSSGSVGVTNSTLSGNSAADYGGGFINVGTMSLTSSTLSGNSANFGGGFYNGDGGTVSVTNSTLSGNSADFGGGFSNFGTMSLTSSTLSGNSAEDDGGGFFNASSGAVSLTNSTLSSNLANSGGGFANGNNGTVSMTDSTLSDNTAFGIGGGFSNDEAGTVSVTNSTLSSNVASVGGGIFNDGTASLSNGTLSDNFAGYDSGGGLFNQSGGTFNLTNSIIANSTGTTSAVTDCQGTLTVNLQNLIEDGSCSPAFSGDPNLGPLTDNGGPTETHALLVGSTAINTGLNCAGPPVNGLDQRGFTRDALCDIGAFEFNALPSGDNIGVQRGGQWFLDRNGNGQWDGCNVDACYVFGTAGDRPVAGDWDGDGFATIGMLRNGQWFLDNGNGAWDGCGNFPTQDVCISFGGAGDQPVAGDWDNDGITEIGVFRNGQWFLDNGNGAWDGCGAFPTQDRCLSFGNPGDQPIAGDWDNDGVTEIGVRRGSNWFLDNGNGVLDSCGAAPNQDVCISGFGIAIDQPIAGDWNGDGFAGIGVKRNSDWYLDRNANDQWDGCTTDSCLFGWGVPEDKPISGRWKP